MYVKIFAGILKSSIASCTPLRRFFMDFLLLADRDGNVIATRDAIAKDLGVDRSEVDWGIAKLQEPDPESGNPENEGRRISPLDGRGYGWKIHNYEFYRGIRSADDLRAAAAKRQARYRAGKVASEPAPAASPDKSDVTRNVTDSRNVTGDASNAIAYAEAKAYPNREVHTGTDGVPGKSSCSVPATVQASVALNALGVRATSQNPDLIAAINEGCTVEELVAVAKENPGKPLRYLTSIVRRQLAEGAAQIVPAAARTIAAGAPKIGKQVQAIINLENALNGGNDGLVEVGTEERLARVGLPKLGKPAIG